jgi:CheY-like chemotaxis protein/HPt (histidine-containing phosphotransfer) domain-containing protein
MRTACAPGAKEALEILRCEAAAGFPYEVVLLDLQMPDIDGLMLAETIQKDPVLAGTRLILLTSIGQHYSADHLRRFGIAASLIKPVKQSDLFRCLLRVMSGEKPAVAGHAAREWRPVQKAGSVPSSKESIKPLRILLAEDNPVNQRVALRQLQKLGYTADGVANGLEVLEALRRIPYNVILMDCQMPEMDGYEAARRIRQQGNFPELGWHIQIIAMTANAMQGDRERCLEAGMDDYISKPVRIDDLRAALERAGENCAPVPFPATQRVSVNRSVLEDLRALGDASGEDPLGEFVDLFLEDAPQRIRELRHGLAAREQQSVARTAHALKGSCGNLGLERMADLCGELEQAAKGGSPEQIPAVMKRIESEYAKVAVELNPFRSGRGSIEPEDFRATG